MNEYVAIPCIAGRKGKIPYTRAVNLNEAVDRLFDEEMIAATSPIDQDSCRVALTTGKEYLVARLEKIKPSDKIIKREDGHYHVMA